jgi:DNA-binding HxlR family transcriptional regulator
MRRFTFATPKQEGLIYEAIMPGKPRQIRTIQNTRSTVPVPENLQRERPQGQSPDKGLKLMTLSDLAKLPAADWLVSGIIPDQGLACVYGAPGSGKSFLALDLALSIATGRPWFGHPVKSGKVIYIAAEGSPANLFRRIEAWFQAHKVSQSQAEGNFLLWPGAVDLLSTFETDKLTDRIRQSVDQSALLAVDTVARSFGGGDENSTKDMSIFIKNIDCLRHRLNATALLVHHSGKDSSRGARGSVALAGACDTMMLLSRADNVHTLKCEKQKDAEPFDPYKLLLAKQDDSAVLQLAAGRVLSVKLSSTQQLILDALLAPVCRDQGATFGGLRNATESSEKTLSRALNTLCERGLVQAEGAAKSPNRRYTATPQGEAALQTYEADMEMDKQASVA